jgi:hypothetical protein
MTSYRNLLLAFVVILFSACGGETDQSRAIERAAEAPAAAETETQPAVETANDAIDETAPAALEAIEESP